MFTNETSIPLPVAVWLAAQGDYDLNPEPNLISATSLQRPLRSLVLARRVLQERSMDIELLLPSKLGTAAHAAAEEAWMGNYRQALTDLGYPKNVVDSVSINPKTPKAFGPDTIDVYIERRTNKDVNGYTISGKFDFVIDGELFDIKTTKTYSYIAESNNEDYRLQGSIYRWLNPDIITSDHTSIIYIFTDWSPLRAKADSTYPQNRVINKKLNLYSIPETQAYIEDRINKLKTFEDADEAELPLCTDKELWRELPKWAVYKNPNKTQRASRVFDLEQDAMQYNAIEAAGKGLIVKREGQVKRCCYCEASPICSQREHLELQGLIQC